MGWTTGKDSAAPGKFAYELWDDARTIHSVGGYATMQEADRAGARANTNWLLYGVTDPVEVNTTLAMLDADALLAALKGG
jgi:orotidine-5'-phosphate decarboxylase